MDKNYRYVTVINTENYLDGVRTLIYSLNKVKSRYPLVVLVPPQFDKLCCHIMESWGAAVEVAENIELGELGGNNPREYWNNTFFKLNIFKMTQYEKLLFIDSDMIVLENMDHIFEMEHITAVQGGKIIFHWEDINSGFMLIRPRVEEYHELCKLIPSVCERKIAAGSGFGDQDVISYYYKYINKCWEGEHRLDERYNANIRCIHELCVHFGYKNIKVIHFVGAKKPWMFSFAEAVKYVVSYTLHHERYRAMCAFKYFRYVIWAKLKYRMPKKTTFAENVE